MRHAGAWVDTGTKRSSALRFAALGAVGVVLLTACASDYRYVGGTVASDGAYFKVPKDWATFRIAEDETSPEGRPTPITTPSSSEPWTIVFDAAPDATLDHAQEEAPKYPLGVAMVMPLAREQRDQVSMKVLRTLATQDSTDPVEAHGDGTYEVVKYEEVGGPGDVVGERVVFNKQVSPGVWVTTDHTATWDPKSGVIYRFLVKCSSECFEDNRQQIDEVVKSWQVRE